MSSGFATVNRYEKLAIVAVCIMVLTFLTWVMSGCSVRPEATTHERGVVSLTEDVWKGSGLPVASGCMGHVGVVTLASSAFQLQCGRSAFMSVGCVDDRGVGRSRGKVIYVSPEVEKASVDFVIVQLTLKALKGCTKEQRRGKTYLDPIFVDESVNGSVEGRVRERLHGVP